MDSSIYSLLSEKEFIEIARRILAGNYNNTQGFYNDLADYLRTEGYTVQTKNIISTSGISLFYEHQLLQSIYRWRSPERYLRATPGYHALNVSIVADLIGKLLNCVGTCTIKSKYGNT